jgi:hypothetical protein
LAFAILGAGAAVVIALLNVVALVIAVVALVVLGLLGHAAGRVGLIDS